MNSAVVSVSLTHGFMDAYVGGFMQVQCHALQAQVDRLGSESRRRRGLFRWGAFLFGGGADGVRVDESDSGVERTPLRGRKHGRHAPTPATGTPTMARWRRSY